MIGVPAIAGKVRSHDRLERGEWRSSRFDVSTGVPWRVDVVGRERCPVRLFRIGDAVASRNIHAAVYDAFRLCLVL